MSYEETHRQLVLDLLFDGPNCVALTEEQEEGVAEGAEDLLGEMSDWHEDVSILDVLLFLWYLL